MNLKDFLTSRESPPELYWSLVLEEGWVQAGIWYIGEKAAEVVSIGPGAAWEVDDELTNATDAALSSAVQKLPEDYKEPSKTVFGVPSSWVKNGEITEIHLSKIKKLCTDLSLTPVGFVVLPEAIAHLYKSEESSPVNAIILGLGSEFLELSVFKLGNLIGTTQVARSVNLIDDVTEGLSRFEGAAPLPSRFIVYDGKGVELDDAKEALMQSSWNEAEKNDSTMRVKFLHTPKAETLLTDRKVLAVSLAGAAEIGHITQVEPVKKEEVENVVPAEDVTPKDLGFVVGEDVSVKVSAPPAMHTVEPIKSKFNLNIGQYFHKFSSQFTARSLPTLGILAGGIILILGLFWWFYPKADIVIYVSPKTFQQESDITFDNTNSQTITAAESGDKTKATSGVKTVGDKAKGQVQIQNGTANPINISAGPVLISSENLRFDLDSSASVSAAISPGSPGTVTASVTADAIGAEYNLPKDEIFKVGNYPKAEVDATSLADFSGGSSRQISAVSKDDQTNLETDLKGELSGKAVTDLTAKVTDSQIFVPVLAGLDVSSENFDHKVGDEADSLKLSLNVNATGIAADKTKLLEMARGVLKDKIPSGYVLRDSQISFTFTFVDKTPDGKYDYKMVIGANFLPQINTDNIVSQIAGKTTDVAQNYLSTIPGFSRASVTLKPRLPWIFGTLPRVNKNITVEVAAEK